MSLVAFKNNHWLFMGLFFVFFIAYIFFIFGLYQKNDEKYSMELMALGIVPSLFLAGLAKYLVEKYVQKRKEPFWKIR